MERAPIKATGRRQSLAQRNPCFSVGSAGRREDIRKRRQKERQTCGSHCRFPSTDYVPVQPRWVTDMRFRTKGKNTQRPLEGCFTPGMMAHYPPRGRLEDRPNPPSSG